MLGVLPGIIGTLQALEAMKWILGIGESAAGRLVLFDALRLHFREMTVERDPACAICGDQPILTAVQDYEAFCGVGASDGAAGDHRGRALGGAVRANAPQLLDVREPWEFAIAHLPDAVLLPLGDCRHEMGLPRIGS